MCFANKRIYLLLLSLCRIVTVLVCAPTPYMVRYDDSRLPLWKLVLLPPFPLPSSPIIFDYASDPSSSSTYAYLPFYLPPLSSYALYAQITSICRSFLCRQGVPIPTKLVCASCLGLKVWENELEIVCRTRRLGRF